MTQKHIQVELAKAFLSQAMAQLDHYDPEATIGDPDGAGAFIAMICSEGTGKVLSGTQDEIKAKYDAIATMLHG